LRAMEGERLGDEAERARGIALDPRKLLGRTECGQLGFEPPLGDLAARDLEDAGRVVDDQRAERGPAEGALEEDPEGARAAAVDARNPRARGALDDRARRRPRRRRHATLREPVERPLRGPAQRALGSAREHREGGQGLGTVSIGERAERVVQGALGQAAEVLEVEGRSGHPKLHPKNECCGWSRKWTFRAYASTSTYRSNRSARRR